MDYILIIIALIITTMSQLFINSSYNRTKKIRNKHNVTGQAVARHILDQNNLQNVRIEETKTVLGDHYDPKNKVVRLSSHVYHSPSIAAASVAAHECGHAIQDKEGYLFLRIRHSLIPLVNFSSYAGYLAILIGCLFSALDLILIGIILEIVILVFQIITLPVEFNASKRALQQLERENLLDKDEIPDSRKMLSAAAMTYVASVTAAILEILRLILIFGRRND